MVYVCVWLLESKLTGKLVFLFRGKFLFDSFLIRTEITLLKNPKCEVRRRMRRGLCRSRIVIVVFNRAPFSSGTV